MTKPQDPDSRDWIPPEDMKPVFLALRRAQLAIAVVDGDGIEAALGYLIEAVEELAKHVAGDRGRRG